MEGSFMLWYYAFQGELASSRQTGSLVVGLSWQDMKDAGLSCSPELDLWNLFFAAIPINLCFKHFLKLCFLLVFRRGS